jgi:hypothetical protein
MSMANDNKFDGVWKHIKYKKLKRNSEPLFSSIPFNRNVLTIEIKPFMLFKSLLILEYKGEQVSTSICPSDLLENNEGLKNFSINLFRNPQIHSRFLEIEKGGENDRN